MSIKLTKKELRILRAIAEFPPKTNENYRFDLKSRLFPILIEKGKAYTEGELEKIIGDLVRYGFLDWKPVSGVLVGVFGPDTPNKVISIPPDFDIKYFITQSGFTYLNEVKNRMHDTVIRIFWIIIGALIGAVIGTLVGILINLAFIGIAGGAIGGVSSQLIGNRT